MSRPTHSVDEAGWSVFVGRHGVGDVVDVRVVDVVPFGAFVRVDEGVDGLAPRADWPSLPVVGARLPVRIAAIDAGNRRFSVHPAS